MVGAWFWDKAALQTFMARLDIERDEVPHLEELAVAGANHADVLLQEAAADGVAQFLKAQMR